MEQQERLLTLNTTNASENKKLKRFNVSDDIHLMFFPNSGNVYITIHRCDDEMFDMLSEREGTETKIYETYRTLNFKDGKIEVDLFNERGIENST